MKKISHQINYALTALFLVFTLSLSAQQLKGVVEDIYSQPLSGVYIYNLNSEAHAHTLDNGAFVIENTKPEDTLSVSLLGFKKLNIVLKKEDFNQGLNISLERKIFRLNELVLNQEVEVLNALLKIDVDNNPINSSQEILQKVPGLIIGQHAGGGKAEQLFLRGFDIDHGTDVSINVDGIPVNNVSHAHGQGYSDLHFLIPETIKNLDFGKGPYYANARDFTTAGYVNFKTKNYLDSNVIKLSYGQFNSIRTLGLFNLIDKSKSDNAYVGIEYIETDGPFNTSQNFNRLNLFGKYNTFINSSDRLAITASHFTSRWDASGQIPQRKVDDGTIDRYGAIDDTEGGNTSRTNLNVEFLSEINENTTLKSNVFYSHYDFELYSNFTFFLEDPINGDQIKQKENRNIFGFNAQIDKFYNKDAFDVETTAGIGLRHDKNDDVELSHTLNRNTTLENIQLGDINQTNAFAFYKAKFDFGRFEITPGLRLEYFKFLYNDKLLETYNTQSETKTALLPKLNIVFRQNENLQWFLKSGIGFHSNDARVVVAQEGEDILPKAYGVDFGTIYKPFSKLFLNATVWYLHLDQEFVYVGDAGIVEPSGKTKRLGLDLGLRYELNEYLYLNTDATLTQARAIDEVDGEDHIPLAPSFTLVGGLALKDFNNFSGSFRYRYIDDRPANEDYSVTAEGYFVTDFNINYQFNKNLNLGVSIENLFDVEWNETQFLTESRLQNEAASVEEIHFTPGTPFNAKMILTYKF
ncbi:TonB-dependent receptor domain-containing protein [Lacinutrix sp. 5H-3-7-4]|uniref:TonB-dependent receptor n=1 Tax=Lacinutrix sp. (strain 5H-3-7-4) TaxID=983544 RepID=UPI00020A3420|nr:TonB-dependent receptor [Lacinutrix sp. 5H-3-7-4]AEH01802.1 TonB-dependent receptor [Lacinutrix sp. 5H-3-7-4]